MKKTVTALSLMLASASASAAPLVDFWAGAYSWNSSYEGTVSATPNSFDMQDDLNLEDSDNNVLWAAFEHPVPLIPNVQVKQTSMDTMGVGTVTGVYEFGGEQFVATGEVQTFADLSHTDYTAYWGLPLPVVTVDFGLNIRKFDGLITIEDATADLDFAVPMAFARVGAYLPLTGLSIMGEANYIGYKDTDHLDYQVALRYTLDFIPALDINLEAGYRSFQMNIDPTDFDGDEDDLAADIDMSGVFLGVSVHL